MSESKPTDETSKAKLDDIKSESCTGACDKYRRYSDCGLYGVRCRGGMILIQAVLWNTGTCRFDDKGETQVAKITRVRVPIQSTGAEQLVVASRPGNVGGAKGLHYSVWFIGQPFGRNQ